MLLAALVDNGASLNAIKEMLGSIKEIRNEWDISISNVIRSQGQISAKYINVKSVFNHQPAATPGDNSHSHADNSNSYSYSIVESHTHENNCTESTDNADEDHTHSHAHNHINEDLHSQTDSRHHDHGHTHKNNDNSHSNNDNNDNLSHSHSFHKHTHSTAEHDHDHHDRGLVIIRNMINTSNLPDIVKMYAIKAFTELATAESYVHGTSIENVHFHEVGAIDSIIDTCGVVVALHLLGVTEVYCSALPMGSGTVWTAHGLLPVPAPATLLLMKDMILTPGPKGVTGELVTPTGASLIRALCGMAPLASDSIGTLNVFSSGASSGTSAHRQGTLPPDGFRLLSIGIGAGKNDFAKHPNILRILVGEINENTKIQIPISINTMIKTENKDKIEFNKISDTEELGIKTLKENDNADLINSNNAIKDVVNSSDNDNNEKLWQEEEMMLLECNIDDSSPELLSYLLDLLLSAGTRDVWTENINMKKNRSGLLVNVLCLMEDKNKFLTIIFEESSSIGVRISTVNRAALVRKFITLDTIYGDIQAKVSYLGSKVTTIKPEFEDCKKKALERRVPLKKVLDCANVIAQKYY